MREVEHKRLPQKGAALSGGSKRHSYFVSLLTMESWLRAFESRRNGKELKDSMTVIPIVQRAYQEQTPYGSQLRLSFYEYHTFKRVRKTWEKDLERWHSYDASSTAYHEKTHMYKLKRKKLDQFIFVR